MNYFKLIKAFYDRQLINPMSTGQLQLWNVLVYINNQCFWQEWFTAANQTLELLTGLSKSAILKNRNALKQSGLIDFKTSGTKACKYKLIDISTQDSVQESTQDSVRLSERISKSKVSETVNQKCTQSNTLIDININKDINNNLGILTNTSSSDLDTVPTHADEIKIDGLAEDVNSEKENMDDVMFNNAKIIYEAIEYLWNSLGLTKIQGINNARKTMLKARLKEYGKDSFDKCIENIKKSSFLRGQNKNGWTITFDWLIRPNNYVKVLENTYADNKTNNENLIQKSYVKTPTMTGKELEDTILANNDLDKF